MLPKHSKESSPGRQAFFYGRVSAMRAWTDEVEATHVAGYVMASSSKLFYWVEVVLHEDEEEFDACCACKTKYESQIVAVALENDSLTPRRIPCTHAAALLYAALLVKDHYGDELCPFWAKPPRTESARAKKALKTDPPGEWPQKMTKMFLPLQDSVPFRGGNGPGE